MKFSEYFNDVTSGHPTFPTWYTNSSPDERAIVKNILYRFSGYELYTEAVADFDESLHNYVRLFAKRYGIADRLQNSIHEGTNFGVGGTVTTVETFTGSEYTSGEQYENGVNSVTYDSTGNMTVRNDTERNHSNDYEHRTEVTDTHENRENLARLRADYLSGIIGFARTIEECFSPLFITVF